MERSERDLSGLKVDLLLVGVTVLAFAALLALPPVRVGDGAEYYAMFLAWRETLSPYMSAHSWDAYGHLVAVGRISSMVPTASLQGAFPALHLGPTSDFNHFWFYSGLAAVISWAVALARLNLSPHAAFVFTHCVLFAILLVTSRHCYGWRGVLAVLGITILSPIIWYANKVHTEFFTYCVSLSAVILAMRRHYIVAAFFLAVAATQNPTFAGVAFVALLLQLEDRRGRVYALREVLLIAFTLFLALLHPMYYFFRLHALTPQLLTGGAKVGALWRNWYVWFLDPDIGLLPNWPAGAVMGILAIWVTYRRPSIFEDRTGWWIFAAAFFAINLLAQTSTENVNSGATPGIARYALWYIPLFFPIALAIIEPFKNSKMGLIYAAGTALLSVAYNVAFNGPQRPESYTSPSVASYLIQKYLPGLFNPYYEIFAERYSGVGEAVWQHSVLGVLGPDCRKMLVFPAPGAKEVLGGRSCMLDPELLVPALEKWINAVVTSRHNPVYMTLSNADVRGAAFRCVQRFDFTSKGNVPMMARAGFDAPEDHGSWSDGPRASFACLWPRTAGAKPTRIRIAAHGFVWGDRVQWMRITVNGGPLHEVVFTKMEEQKVIEVGARIGDSSTIAIHFSFPDAVSPLALGLSADPRKLGVAISSIQFEQ